MHSQLLGHAIMKPAAGFTGCVEGAHGYPHHHGKDASLRFQHALLGAK
ncbi:hypothetical protein [Citrobacter braakii]|nr:hypothetical protein [Citrobacter braakii]